jgi:hypothetical protein
MTYCIVLNPIIPVTIAFNPKGIFILPKAFFNKANLAVCIPIPIIGPIIFGAPGIWILV